MRRGAIGQVRRGRLAFVAEVRSLAHVLNQTVGRTFQHACDAELGDARCGVDLEDPDYKGTGSVIALTGDRSFTASGLGGFAAGWFTLGRLTWTSGANAGRTAEVASHAVAAGERTLALLEAPVRPIAAGDDFVVRAGCDKRLETCRDRFANVVELPRLPAHPRPGHGDPLPEPRRRQQRRGAVTAADPGARHRRRPRLARHAVPRPGERARASAATASGWCAASGASSMGPSRCRCRPTAATGARPAAASRSPRRRGGDARDAAAELTPGALILFRMRAGAVAKHCGILTAPDRFVHAYERTGVIEEPLTAAWRRRIAFAFLFPAA